MKITVSRRGAATSVCVGVGGSCYLIIFCFAFWCLCKHFYTLHCIFSLSFFFFLSCSIMTFYLFPIFLCSCFSFPFNIIFCNSSFHSSHPLLLLSFLLLHFFLAAHSHSPFYLHPSLPPFSSLLFLFTLLSFTLNF